MLNTQYKPVFIDGYPYGVRLLTSKEWDDLIDVVGENDNLIHYSKTASWVQDKKDDWSSRYIVRGGQQARTKDSLLKDVSGPIVGFRPCLVPLNLSTYEPDASRFSNVKDGGVITFGTIGKNSYLFSVPKTQASEGDIEDNYGSDPVHIGDSTDDFKCNIQWVKSGNLLVADRNLLKYVSWGFLDMCGLVYGKTEKSFDKEPIQPGKTYTQDDLTYHQYYEGICKNKHDVLENACWSALARQRDYKVSKSGNNYKLSMAGVSYDMQYNDVALIHASGDCVYVEEGPAWGRDTKNKTIDELIATAQTISEQARNLSENLQKHKDSIEREH